MSVRDKLKQNAEQQVNSQADTEVKNSDDFQVAIDSSGEVDVEATQKNIRDTLRKTAELANKDKPKPEHFLWVKMWISYLLSMFLKDRGKIPDNIGDKILITNNMYITKQFMSTIIHIYEFGPYTPVTFMEVLNGTLRERGNEAILDLTMKNTKYEYNPKNSGLQSRISTWNNILESDTATRRNRERAARCLYTVEIAQSGKQLKNSRTFLTVRAKNVATLNAAEKIIFATLGKMGCTYLPAYATIRNNLEYISLIGNRTNDIKGVVPVMTSNVILSQVLPNCGSFNDKSGYYVGQNVLNGSPYFIDFSTITVARNMYVVAPSGVGKTVLALNMAQSAYENNAACCFMDIKGNEYTAFINATNGYIVSLRPNSIEYINSWIMHKEEVDAEHAEAYFKSRVQFSKQQMIILSGIRDREELLEFEELLDEFHESLYISIGAIPTNINSWKNTERLNPYVVFDKFESFLTPQKRAQYNLHKSVMGTLRMYMCATGSKSYVFKREFNYSNILDADTVSFDFGILGDAAITDIDEDLFRLKFLYMSKLNGDFTTRKYAEGRRTFKVLEESQVVSDDIMQMYVQEYTLRRSQNQDTLLLGNSVQALSGNPLSKPLIENTRGLFIGDLTLDARNIVIEQFGLQHLKDLIKVPGSSNRYKNCFVFVNNMQTKSLFPIIQVEVEQDEYGKFKKYKINTPVKEGNTMSGGKR